MSFAVFGASMDFCLKTARKKVKMTKGFGKNLQQLTQAEWEEAVQTYAEKLFEDYATGKKVPVQISGNMTTPNAAKDFIALAKKTSMVAALRIYQRQPVKGRINPRTKEPVMKFQPYRGAV
jgi:hypothetical protein